MFPFWISLQPWKPQLEKPGWTWQMNKPCLGKEKSFFLNPQLRHILTSVSSTSFEINILNSASFFCTGVIAVKMFPCVFPGFPWEVSSSVLHGEHTQLWSVPSASETDTARGACKTAQECAEEVHCRNVRSLRECYCGYYPTNPSKPLPAPADTSLYLQLTWISTGSSSGPAFSAPSLFCVPSQREVTKAGVVPGRKGALQKSVGILLSCTHSLVLCTGGESRQTRSWCSLPKGKLPTECVWVLWGDRSLWGTGACVGDRSCGGTGACGAQESVWGHRSLGGGTGAWQGLQKHPLTALSGCLHSQAGRGVWAAHGLPLSLGRWWLPLHWIFPLILLFLPGDKCTFYYSSQFKITFRNFITHSDFSQWVKWKKCVLRLRENPPI